MVVLVVMDVKNLVTTPVVIVVQLVVKAVLADVVAVQLVPEGAEQVVLVVVILV